MVDCVAKDDGDDEVRWVETSLHICAEDDNSIHLHIDVYRNDPRKSKGKAKKWDGVAKPIAEFLKLAKEAVEKEGEEVYCQSRARFRVARRDIPEYGMIAGLLNFQKTSCSKSFSLTGAVLEIEDDVFDLLRFRYDEDKEVVFVELWASGPVDLNGEYLARFAELMEVGAEYFVLEGSEREQHAQGKA